LDGTPAGYHPALQLVQEGRLDASTIRTVIRDSHVEAVGHADDRSAFWVDLDYLVLILRINVSFLVLLQHVLLLEVSPGFLSGLKQPTGGRPKK